MRIPKSPYQWLPWVIVFMGVGALLHAAFAIHQLEQQKVVAAGENLTRVATDIADKLDLLMLERYGDIQTMAKSKVFHDQDVNAMNELLALLQKAYPVYQWLAVTDTDGRIIASTNPTRIGDEVTGVPWFEAVRNSGRVHIGEKTPPPNEEEGLAVAFSAPIIGPSTKFLGAVMAQVGLSVFLDIFERTVLPMQIQGDRPTTVEWNLLDKNGNLLVDSRLKQVGKINLRDLGVPSALAGGSKPPGYFEEWHKRREVPIVRGFARTQGVGKFPGLEWTVLVSMDRADIIAPLHQIIWNLGLIGMLMFVPLVGLLFWLSRRLRQEWSQAQAEAVRAVRAEQEYRATRDQLTDVLDHAPDPIFFSNTEGTLTRLSRGGERVLGYRLETMVPKNVEDLFRDPTQWKSLLSELKMKGEVIGREVELRTLDGDPVNISLTLTALRNSEGYTIGTVGLCKDVTAAKRTEESLRISNEELENFVYAISHDLQAPLRGIQGFAVLLLKRAQERLDPQERRYIERIQKGAERMEELIRDLLEYSRIERITHPWEPVAMEPIILQARTQLEERIQQTHADVAIEGPFPSLYGDRVRLGQLWTNLLSNAIKYARPEEPPVIRIGCQEGKDHVLFYIRDNGIGIAPEFRLKIFGIFNRLHTKDQIEGTGIGLAIVKRIVEFHKGRVWVESVEGEGSTFFFTLPRNQGGSGKAVTGSLSLSRQAGREVSPETLEANP